MTSSPVQLSRKFKLQTAKAIAAISIFALIYLLFFIGAALFAVWCIYAGVKIILIHPSYLTILLGIGMGSWGILILHFFIKTISTFSQTDVSGYYELKQEDAPELYGMIEKIVDQVGTHFPNKIYISPEVNASVFYDSSFWSMFLPIKKNLLIGMGLVNSTTKSELEAILAHEFGHFSQKTMKVGSYVYHVNQIIFRLFNSQDFQERYSAWQNQHYVFYLFVWLALKLIQGIQLIFGKLYGLVNLSYMGLSREMEFHADAIAVSITGSQPLKTSLLRMDLAQFSLSSVLSFYEGKIVQNTQSENIFKEQSYIMALQADLFKLPISNNFPQVALETLSRFNKSKLVIGDQWASHPSLPDRIQYMESLNATGKENDSNPAIELFPNVDQVQEELTQQIFRPVQYGGAIQKMPLANFCTEYKSQIDKNAFSPFYNCYYDDKNPSPLNFKTIPQVKPSVQEIEELFSENQVAQVYTAISQINDIQVISQIANKEIDTSSFDYGGIKYRRRAAKKLIPKLELDLEQLNKQIEQHDAHIYACFSFLEKRFNEETKLESLYSDFFEFDKCLPEAIQTYNELSECLQFVHIETPANEILIQFRAVASIEVRLKNLIQTIVYADPQKLNASGEVLE
ncbi:MAG: M48 family metallopeptidase, partial [Saprospiraceae bacterium]